MQDDLQKTLINQAHSLFNKVSIFELIDLERGAATDVLRRHYDSIDPVMLDKYFNILDQIKKDIG